MNRQSWWSSVRRFLSGPRGLMYALAVFVLGSLFGVGLFTFGYASGASYLLDDPKACVNCHVMNNEYNGWLKSGHGKVATCNDCHVPHNLVGKYLTKAENGWHHGLAMTTGNFPDAIRARESSLKIVEDNCLRCHQEITSNIQGTTAHKDGVSCIRCHAHVGHM